MGLDTGAGGELDPVCGKPGGCGGGAGGQCAGRRQGRLLPDGPDRDGRPQVRNISVTMKTSS